MTKKNTLSWHPWRTKSIIVTAENRVEEIPVDSVLEATNTLMKDSYHEKFKVCSYKPADEL